MSQSNPSNPEKDWTECMIIFNYVLATVLIFGVSISLIMFSFPVKTDTISFDAYNITLMCQLVTVIFALIISLVLLFKNLE